MLYLCEAGSYHRKHASNIRKKSSAVGPDSYEVALWTKGLLSLTKHLVLLRIILCIHSPNLVVSIPYVNTILCQYDTLDDLWDTRYIAALTKEISSCKVSRGK